MQRHFKLDQGSWVSEQGAQLEVRLLLRRTGCGRVLHAQMSWGRIEKFLKSSYFLSYVVGWCSVGFSKPHRISSYHPHIIYPAYFGWFLSWFFSPVPDYFCCDRYTKIRTPLPLQEKDAVCTLSFLKKCKKASNSQIKFKPFSAFSWTFCLLKWCVSRCGSPGAELQVIRGWSLKMVRWVAYFLSSISWIHVFVW